MPGLVVTDLMGGDAHWCVVDDELWQQIVGLDYPDTHNNLRLEAIGYLTCKDPEVYKPEHAPERRGQILREFFTQTGVLEHEKLDGIVGILTLQAT